MTTELKLTITYHPGGPTAIRYEILGDFSFVQNTKHLCQEQIQCKTSSKQQPIEGIQGRIKLLGILSPITQSRPQCNTIKLLQIAYTLEWIRLGEVCRAVLSDKTARSNKDGLIQFPDFSIDRGPEGTYLFDFHINDQLQSEVEQISFASTVARMVVNTAPPLVVSIGTQFQSQPQITLYDQNDNPVQGKKVIAFTWVDSYFDPDFFDEFLVVGAKLGLLEGAVSEASDSSGVARFTNLKVTLSAVSFVHIFFCVDGKIVEPWLSNPLKPPAPGVPIPPQSRFPIFLRSTVSRIEFVTQPSSTVTEGEIWSVQPKLRVLDEQGSPVAGQSVMAISYGGPNKNPPLSFKNKLGNVPNKMLLNPIQGTFGDLQNYFQGTEAAFTPLYTDSSGQIQYTSLAWSTQGEASASSNGQYFVIFACNGATTDVFTQQVLSKVSSISFPQPLPSVLSISSTSIFDTNLRLRVTDSNGNGVSGKYITRVVHSVSSPNQDDDIVVSLRNDLDEFSTSDNNGFMSVPLKINVLKVNSLTVTFTFSVDDVTITSSSVTVNGNIQTTQTTCAYIETQTAPPSTATNQNPFTPVYKIVLQNGEPLANHYATLGVFFVTEYPYKISESVINSVNDNQARVQSDASGLLTFTNFEFLQQPSGTLYLQVVDEDLNCKSDFATVTLQDTVDSVELLSPQNSQLGSYDQTIPLDTDQATTIKLLKEDGTPSTGTQVTLSLRIAHMPANLYSDYLQGSLNPTIFFTLSGTTFTSDGDGNINFNWKLGKGRSGYWTILFFIDGKYTVPFAFKTTWDSAATVSIITQPTASGNEKVGNYLDSNGGAVIEVRDSGGSVMENFMVSTMLIPVNQSGQKDTSQSRKEGMLDIYTTTFQDFEAHRQAGTLDQIKAAFITLTGEKNVKTNASGRATLNELNIMDVEGTEAACFKFYFYIGSYQGNNVVSSPLSDAVCFINTMEISITNTPSSKIAPNQAFSSPVTVRITKADASDADKTGLILLVGVISSINRATVTDKHFGSQSYLQNNVCIFNNKENLAGGCSNIDVKNDGTNGSYIAQTTFNNLVFSLIQNVDLVARFSTPFQSEAHFIDSSQITVSVQAEHLEFVEQPPTTVQINQIFQVRVRATLTNGAPVSFVEVKANITASSSVSTFSNSIFNFAANLQTSISHLNELSGGNNIRIDREGASAITNANGTATLSLQIVQGITGNYSVVVSAGQNVQSAPSRQFLFNNQIRNVAEVRGIAQTRDVRKETINNRDVYRQLLNPQPVISVTSQDGSKMTGLVSGFSVIVISQSDVLSAYNNLGLSEGDPSPGVSTILENIGQPRSQADQAIQTITNAWTIFTKGASNVGASQRRSLGSSASFSVPTLNSENNYAFSDLRIAVPSAQKYQLIFMVDGVESDLSEVIQINEKNDTSNNQAVVIVLSILIFLVLFFLLYSVITSNAYTYSRCTNLIYIIVSLIVCIIFLVVALQANYTYNLKIFITVTVICIIASLVYAIIQLFCPKCRRYIFYVEWERAARQYTYQKLFSRPSNKWIAAKGKPGSFISKRESHPEELQKLGQRKNVEYGEFSFFKQKMMKRIAELFVPFQFSANRLNIGDCFFYPQRFFIGFLIAFVGFVFIAVNLLLFIVRIRNSINSLKRNVIETIFKFVRVGVKSIYTWVKLDVADSNINPFISTSHTIEDFLDKASFAFYIGSIIATVLGTILMLCSIFTLFYDYKKRVLQARIGVWPYPKERFSIVGSTSYVGSLISTFLLGYAVIVVLLTVIFVPLCHPVTYRLIWAYRVTLIIILLPMIINTVLKIIAKKCCVAKTFVRYRRCYAILDLFLLYLAIPAGVVTGLVRFIIMIVAGILTLSKIDTPIAPMWIMNRIMWIDFPNAAYNALILEHHTHRNPILTTAMYTFFLVSCLKPTNEKRSLNEEDKSMSPKGRRIARRLQIALLLSKYPSLIKLRKHNLPPKKGKKGRQGKSPAPSSNGRTEKNIELSSISPLVAPGTEKAQIEPFSEQPYLAQK